MSTSSKSKKLGSKTLKANPQILSISKAVADNQLDKVSEAGLLETVNKYLKRKGHLKGDESIISLGVAPELTRCLEWRTETRVENGRIIITRECLRRE